VEAPFTGRLCVFGDHRHTPPLLALGTAHQLPKRCQRGVPLLANGLQGRRQFRWPASHLGGRRFRCIRLYEVGFTGRSQLGEQARKAGPQYQVAAPLPAVPIC
jgi:hypothetical protein